MEGLLCAAVVPIPPPLPPAACSKALEMADGTHGKVQPHKDASVRLPLSTETQAMDVTVPEWH